jgi:outer membrane protein TolC
MAEPSPKNRAPSLHTRIGEYTLVCASLALILVSGCKPVGPNYNRPGYSAPPAYKESGATTVVLPPPNPQGGAWQPANPSDGMLKGKWWEIYQDPQLNKLEERIDSSNVQLRQAMELYLAAEAQVRAARANLYPTLSAGPSISRDRVSANRPLAVPGGATTYGDFVIAGQASWEPDFWGRIRRTVEQARENAQASAADEANVALTLHAEMATDYFALRGLDSQIKLLTDTVTDLEHQLDLTKRRFPEAWPPRWTLHRRKRSLKPFAHSSLTLAWRARSTNTPLALSPTTACPASAFRRRRSILRCPKFR